MLLRNRIRHWRKTLSDQKGAVFLEYALLVGMLVVTLGPLAPGGTIYNNLATDLIFRLWVIALPIF